MRLMRLRALVVLLFLAVAALVGEKVAPYGDFPWCHILAVRECVLPGTAHAQPYQNWPFRQPNLPTDLPPAFSLAPPSGAGLPVAQTLCSQLSASELDGGWCLNGDGSMAAGGSFTLSATGSPTPSTQTDRVCPNGPDCASETSLRFGSTGRYSSSDTTANHDEETVCAVAALDGDNGATQVLVGHTNGTGQFSFSCDIAAVSGFTCTANRADATTSVTGNTAPTTSAINVYCGSYSVADGRARAYVNGSAATAGAASATPALSAANVPWNVGNAGNGGYPFPGRVFGAFRIRTQLSADRLATIASAVLADAPTNAKGNVALTCTRASASSCATPYDTEASVTDLPANRCCIAGGPAGTGALARYGAYEEKLLRTSEFDNVAWSDVGTPTVTANSTVAPNGTLTADTVNDNDGAAFEGRTQDVAGITATSATTLSAYVLAGTGTKLRLSNDGTTCDFTVTATFARYKCADASASGTTTTQQILVGNAVGDTGTIIVWRVNLTQTDRLMPSVDATSAAVSVAETIPAMTLTPPAAGFACIAGSIWGHSVPTPAAGATTTALGLWKHPSGGLYWGGYLTSGTWRGSVQSGANVDAPGTYTNETIARLLMRTEASSTVGTTCLDGACASGATTWTRLTQDNTVWNPGGYSTAGYAIDGWIWNVQADSNPMRCR